MKTEVMQDRENPEPKVERVEAASKVDREARLIVAIEVAVKLPANQVILKMHHLQRNDYKIIINIIIMIVMKCD